MNEIEKAGDDEQGNIRTLKSLKDHQPGKATAVSSQFVSEEFE